MFNENKTRFFSSDAQKKISNFNNTKKIEIFIYNVYEAEQILKKCMILTNEFLDDYCKFNSTSEEVSEFYRRSLPIMVGQVSIISNILNGKYSKESDLMEVTLTSYKSLSNLYEVCNIIKDSNRYLCFNNKMQTKVNEIINLIKPYIVNSVSKDDYAKLYTTILVKEAQNQLIDELNMCKDIKNYDTDFVRKVYDIKSIVKVLLKENDVTVDKISRNIKEIIRK